MPQQTQPIEHRITIPATPDTAFERFSAQFGHWWPSAYTWSQETLVNISIEPRTGGRCTETGPNGFQVDWGRVLNWKPPHQLTIAWHISPQREPQPNPQHASTVVFQFKPTSGRHTHLYLHHSELDNHGEGAQGYRDALASEYGWSFILDCYLKSFLK